MIRYMNFLITEENGKLNFKNLKTGQEKKGIKVVPDNERKYTYKCQKTQIKTVHKNAEGLLKLFQKALDEKFMDSMIACVCKQYVGDCDYDFT